eukprot:6737199-Prymnesium_polylepis.1
MSEETSARATEEGVRAGARGSLQRASVRRLAGGSALLPGTLRLFSSRLGRFLEEVWPLLLVPGSLGGDTLLRTFASPARACAGLAVGGVYAAVRLSVVRAGAQVLRRKLERWSAGAPRAVGGRSAGALATPPTSSASRSSLDSVVPLDESRIDESAEPLGASASGVGAPLLIGTLSRSLAQEFEL